MSNPNRITQGEAIAGALISETTIEGVDVTASGTVTSSDVTTTDDVTVGDDLAVTGDTTTTTLKVGASGTVIKTIKTGSAAIDFASVAAGETGSGTITVTGAAVGDAIIVQPGTYTTGLGFAGATVTGANTVTVYVVNASANPIDESSATHYYTWIDLT